MKWTGCVRLLAACLAAVSLWALPATAQPASDFYAFRDLVAQRVRAQHPGARIVLLERIGLSVTLPGDPEPHQQDLRRAYALYAGAEDDAAREEIVGSMVAGFAPVTIQAENLLVLVRSLDTFPGRSPGKGVPVRPLVGPLVAIIAVDGPSAYSYRSAGELRAKLNMDVAALWDRAIRNTRRQTGFTPQPPEPGHVIELSTGHGLASSLLADDAFWDSPVLASEGPLVVAPLARDDILITPLKNARAVDGLRRMMAKVAGDPNNLGEGLIIRRDGRWEVLR